MFFIEKNLNCIYIPCTAYQFIIHLFLVLILWHYEVLWDSVCTVWMSPACVMSSMIFFITKHIFITVYVAYMKQMQWLQILLCTK